MTREFVYRENIVAYRHARGRRGFPSGANALWRTRCLLGLDDTLKCYGETQKQRPC